MEKEQQLKEIYKKIFREKLESGETLFKKQLIRQFNIHERQIRLYISELASEMPIIALSHKRGYRLATENDEIEIRKQIKELTHRQEKLELRKRPLREKLLSITGGQN